MVTRVVAVKNLEKYIEQDLLVWASKFGITSFINGKQNKGWKGQTLERFAGLAGGNEQAPNGLGFELKSTAFHQRNNLWVPKETMAITMINPATLVTTPFYKSHCWEKLKTIVFCAVTWNGHHNSESKLLSVQSFDFIEDSQLIKEIEADYEFIRAKLIHKGFSALTGKDGKWIQARTKGKGHGSISRAFYARRNLLTEIFQLNEC
jgi:DNA mismatch repair protein MutH